MNDFYKNIIYGTILYIIKSKKLLIDKYGQKNKNKHRSLLK